MVKIWRGDFRNPAGWETHSGGLRKLIMSSGFCPLHHFSSGRFKSLKTSVLLILLMVRSGTQSFTSSCATVSSWVDIHSFSFYLLLKLPHVYWYLFHLVQSFSTLTAWLNTIIGLHRKDDSFLKCTWCFFRGPNFNSQHPY